MTNVSAEEEVHELKFEEMLNVKELRTVRQSVNLAAVVPVQWRTANHRNETLRWLAKAAKNEIQERNFAFFSLSKSCVGAKRYKLFACVCFSLMNLPQRVPYPPGGPGHAYPHQMHPDQTSHRPGCSSSIVLMPVVETGMTKGLIPSTPPIYIL